MSGFLIRQRISFGIKAETDVYNCAEDMKEELSDEDIPYDVYFLDIELGDDNGISLAKWIKAAYKEGCYSIYNKPYGLYAESI